MATDPTAVKELARLIGDLSRALEDGETPKKDARDTLVDAAERLAIAARDPEDNMYSIAGQVRATSHPYRNALCQVSSHQADC